MDAALRLWIPKTGGSTLHSAICSDSMVSGPIEDTFIRPTIHDNAVLLSVGHLTPKMLVDKKLMTPDQIRNIWTFAVVRNPWARFVSMWCSMGPEPSSAYRGGFDEFIERVIQDYSITNAKEKTPLGMSTEEFLTLDGELVADHILFTESLSKDWKSVAERLGFRSQKIGRVNAHKYPPYQRFYHSDFLVGLVAKHEAWAIEMFGYQFEDKT